MEEVETGSSSSSDKQKIVKNSVEEVKVVPPLATEAALKHPKFEGSKDPSTNPVVKFGIDTKLQDTGSVSRGALPQEPFKGSHNTVNKNKETVLSS